MFKFVTGRRLGRMVEEFDEGSDVEMIRWIFHCFNKEQDVT